MASLTPWSPSTGTPEKRGIPVRGSTSSVAEVSRLTPGATQPWGSDTTPGRIAAVILDRWPRSTRGPRRCAPSDRRSAPGGHSHPGGRAAPAVCAVAQHRVRLAELAPVDEHQAGVGRRSPPGPELVHQLRRGEVEDAAGEPLAGSASRAPGTSVGATPDGAARSVSHGTRDRRAAAARIVSSVSRFEVGEAGQAEAAAETGEDPPHRRAARGWPGRRPGRTGRRGTGSRDRGTTSGRPAPAGRPPAGRGSPRPSSRWHGCRTRPGRRGRRRNAAAGRSRAAWSAGCRRGRTAPAAFRRRSRRPERCRAARRRRPRRSGRLAGPAPGHRRSGGAA